MKLFLIAAMLLFTPACNKTNTNLNDGPAAAKKLSSEVSGAVTAAATPREVIICDQKNARIIMVDIANNNQITWEWKASGSYAMIHSAAQAWFSNLSDAKLVYNGSYILATASGGGVALISVSSKKAIWYDYAGGNTHSAELLPNGNVVTASTTGGYLMIFTVDSYINDQSSQVKAADFEDVHNVVWDHARQQLYAAGKDKLKVFTYNGSCSAPKLTLKATYTMPQGNAHELFPVYGSTTDLWLTNSGNIYKFNVTSGAFTLIKATGSVKSVSSGPSGYPTIIARATGAGGETWRTDQLLDINGSLVYKNTAIGLYKARWKLVNTFSYPAGDHFHECTHP
ncbi:DUF6528 family protein [Niabella pedocola]|uniref:DUF6528 family protein n=1 Tax=Niabella pedocola TaxID=1752077 RepID=A0ABS8PTY7_9BACT|nr:DUF6528 family protein [Niabella pedocola]MCD2424264.1 DUF6528 family protein [Niabella pedocola]